MVHCRGTRWRLYCGTTKEISGYSHHGRRKVVDCSWGHEPWDGGIVTINLIVSMCFIHELLLCFTLVHISNGSVSASLVGHILYSADLMSATCIPHLLLMVHRYIYSRYSSVFLMLYQLYHSLPSFTLNSSSSLYLKLQPELLLKVVTDTFRVCQSERVYTIFFSTRWGGKVAGYGVVTDGCVGEVVRVSLGPVICDRLLSNMPSLLTGSCQTLVTHLYLLDPVPEGSPCCQGLV